VDGFVSGSEGLETLVTVTGSGFAGGNASIVIGDAKCEIQEVTGKQDDYFYLSLSSEVVTT